MRLHHSNGNGTVNPAHHEGRHVFAGNCDLSSLGTRTSPVPINGNLGRIHQYQAGYTGGAGIQEAAVLRHAESAHNAAHARDQVLMGILRRNQTSRPVHPAEDDVLRKRLLGKHAPNGTPEITGESAEYIPTRNINRPGQWQR